MAKFSKVERVSVSAALDPILRQCVDNDTRLFANQTFYRYMFPYIPFVTGAMAETVDIKPDGIHFGQLYAYRNYRGDHFNFSKELHPLAQARWGDVTAAMHGREISREVERYILAKIK